MDPPTAAALSAAAGGNTGGAGGACSTAIPINDRSTRKPVKADHGINPREAAGAQDASNNSNNNNNNNNNSNSNGTFEYSTSTSPLPPSDSNGLDASNKNSSNNAQQQGDQQLHLTHVHNASTTSTTAKDQASLTTTRDSHTTTTADVSTTAQSNSHFSGSVSAVPAAACAAAAAAVESVSRTSTPNNLDRDNNNNTSSNTTTTNQTTHAPPVRRNSAGAALPSSSSRKSASSPRSSPRTTSARRTPSPLHHMSSRSRSPRGNLGVPVGGSSSGGGGGGPGSSSGTSAFAKPAPPAHGKRVAAQGSAILGRNSERRSPVNFMHPDKQQRGSPQPLQHRPKGKSPKNLLSGSSSHPLDTPVGISNSNSASKPASRVSSPSPKLVLSGQQASSFVRASKISTSSTTSLPHTTATSGGSTSGLQSSYAHSNAYVEASTLSSLEDDDQLRDPTPRDLEFLTARPDDLDGPLDIGIEFSNLGGYNNLTTPTNVFGQHNVHSSGSFGGGVGPAVASNTGRTSGSGGQATGADSGGGETTASRGGVRPESPVVLPDMQGRYRSNSWDIGQAHGQGLPPPRSVGVEMGVSEGKAFTGNVQSVAVAAAAADSPAASTRRNSGHAVGTAGGTPSAQQIQQHMQQQQQQQVYRQSIARPQLMQTQQQQLQHQQLQQPYYSTQQHGVLHQQQQYPQQHPQYQPQQLAYQQFQQQQQYHQPPMQHNPYQQMQPPIAWQQHQLPQHMQYQQQHQQSHSPYEQVNVQPGYVDESGELVDQVSGMSLADIERLEQVLSMRKDSLLRSRMPAQSPAVVHGGMGVGAQLGANDGTQQQHPQYQHTQNAQTYPQTDATSQTQQQQQQQQRYNQPQPQLLQKQRGGGPPAVPTPASSTPGISSSSATSSKPTATTTTTPTTEGQGSSALSRRQQQRGGNGGGNKGRFLARSASPVLKRSIYRKPSRDETDSIVSEDFEDIDIGSGAPEDNPRPGSGCMAPDYKMFRSSQQPGTPTSAISGEWGPHVGSSNNNMYDGSCSGGRSGRGGGGGRPIVNSSSSSRPPEGNTRTMATSPGNLSFVNRLSRQPDGEQSAQHIKSRTLKNASAVKDIAQQVNKQARAFGHESTTAPIDNNFNVGEDGNVDTINSNNNDDADDGGSMGMMDPMDGHENEQINNNNNNNNDMMSSRHDMVDSDSMSTPLPDESGIIVASPKSAFVRQ